MSLTPVVTFFDARYLPFLTAVTVLVIALVLAVVWAAYRIDTLVYQRRELERNAAAATRVSAKRAANEALERNSRSRRRCSEAFTSCVAAVVVVVVVSSAILINVAAMRDERALDAVEEKYGVSVDNRDDVNLATRASVWVIDGVGRSCQVSIADRRNPDPVLVCDGVELAKTTQ